VPGQKIKSSTIGLSILLALACSASAVMLLTRCGTRHDNASPSAIDSALYSFQVPKGFKIEVLASEPLIGDPVDMEIDEYGRLFVVEMPGYPLDMSGTGKIKLLSDSNGDGRMDSCVTFADQLVLPNSVMRWKQGILVTDAPYVLYFEDRDGDGKADVRDTVLTGFALSNPQHNLNSPLLGIDNWIYLAHEGAVTTDTYEKEFGDRGSEITFTGHPSSPRLGVNANGRSVRFKPDLGQLQETSGRTQFGHTFDQWGHHFLVGNANHVYYEAIAASYLNRNKQLLVSEATESISDHGEAAEVFPITENPQHQLLTDLGVITSACGLTYYLGGAFPAPYDEQVTFVAEPVSNLVHVDKIQEKGSTFVATRILKQEEFLASRDPKFRPVNLYVGPDGALYVVDYYRQIIEHPEWMGEEVIRSGELYNDTDKGRIYRITPEGQSRPDWTKGMNLGKASAAELVKKLSDKNIWWRMHAQRLLVDRHDSSALPSLYSAAEDESSAVGRVHALWTLQALDALTPALVAKALKASQAGVRETAIRLAELQLPQATSLITPLLSLVADPDAKVRYQLLCTIGSLNTEEADRVRKQLLFQDITDSWVQVAALSAMASSAPALLEEVITKANSQPEEFRSLILRLSAMVAASQDAKAIRRLVVAGSQIPKTKDENRIVVQAAVLNGMATGREDSEDGVTFSPGDQAALVNVVFAHPATDVGRAAVRLLRTGELDNAVYRGSERKARLLALDEQAPDARRALAVEFLSLKAPLDHQTVFIRLLSAKESLPVQLASLKSLSTIPGTSVSQTLVARWTTLTPEVHDAAIATFLSDDERTGLLLTALEENKIQTSGISWPRRVRLMAQSNIPLRDRARKLFTRNDEADIRSSLSNVISLKGDALKGQGVYQQNCALCHQIRGKMGLALGPDLGTVHNWSSEAILSNIVNPNQSISSGYDLCSVELVNGTTAQGIVASESPGAITLRNNGSADRTINRRDIKSLKALNMSIMPGDFAQKINPQQLSDLLAFLKQNK